MANLHYEFDTFHNRIALTTSNKAALRNVRNAIRVRIRNYFRDILELQVPKFHGQGAYVMGTTVNPIHGGFDIDDGVYLQHLDKQDNSKWPTAATVHQWLVTATDCHTREKSMDKRTCVRVSYAGLYHVDLPVYGALNGQCLHAVKGEINWLHSDPLSLSDWFTDQVRHKGEQLRRIVRYLKAWADFQSCRLGKMPGGLILTVLSTNYFQGSERDDLAFSNTLAAISQAIRSIVYVVNPVNSSEELSGRLTQTQIIRFQEAVRSAAEAADDAVLRQDAHESSELWREQFGARFPMVENSRIYLP